MYNFVRLIQLHEDESYEAEVTPKNATEKDLDDDDDDDDEMGVDMNALKM